MPVVFLVNFYSGTCSCPSRYGKCNILELFQGHVFRRSCYCLVIYLCMLELGDLLISLCLNFKGS